MGKQLKFWFLATLTTLMVLAGSILQMGEPLMATQTFSDIAIADQLYIQYPDIPRAPEANTTLLSRFIDYHLNTQARPAHYHLDWELSMADYLDAAYGNRAQQSSTVAYTDKQTMKDLSRQQRHDLVRSLEQRFAQ
ncbi:hypothetical protein [Leptothoe spongobia]|uniref:Uncharacterized protein n=1 Tax=Leptothoe spongobia TAU-MAC 1115 TaxID=1967444 RepID=A0A947DEF6_9CYAN|nr:hypothetical protein [Leptothoe spongobia]MBT9315406.1 hypothetical protein [Leptothoe spongobia TAU-MAC 1115]